MYPNSEYWGLMPSEMASWKRKCNDQTGVDGDGLGAVRTNEKKKALLFTKEYVPLSRSDWKQVKDIMKFAFEKDCTVH